MKNFNKEEALVKFRNYAGPRNITQEGTIIVTPFKGNSEDMKKTKTRKPEYIPALAENQDFDPHYNPDREYPTRRVSSW